MLFEVKNLFVYYSKAKALEDVSLYVEDGEVVSIIGANGAGKTTLLRAISGLTKSTSGEIWFQDKRIDGMPAHDVVKTGISQVPAGKMIIAPMTVMDNLRMGCIFKKDKSYFKEELETVFKYFPILKNLTAQLGGNLSGGQQQMLAVARALMSRPKLMLMDEPSTGLSPLLVAEVANIIEEINKSGISVLLVEQNSHMALKLANRAYVLELGKVVLQGEADKLINDDRVKKHYLGGG